MPCFFSDIDRRFYLKCLSKYATRRGCAVHAYVLMTNHVHLLVTPERPGSVSSMLQDLGRTYVRTINLLHGRTGTLWEGRFKASVIDSQAYLFYCHRYIEMNPVRARIAVQPADYPWSSHEHYALGGSDHLITEHGLYRALAGNAAGRRQAFCSFFQEDLQDDVVNMIRTAANANAALGDAAFLGKVSALAGREVKAPSRGRPRRRPNGTG
jgi:putative transposase